jgi:D-alanyl-D-alanine dipeptidase
MIIKVPKVNFDTFQISDIPANHEPFKLINKIPIHDNGEPLVDLRVTNPELSFGEYCLPYVRQSVAEALKIAYSNVPEHLDLRIFTGLRTLEQQAKMYWSNYEKAQKEHPNWPKSVLRKMTNRFFAPPDAKAPPGHCTGGAIDVGLLNRETGEGLDVSSPLERWKGAPTAAEGLSDEAQQNRRLLCFVMYSTGLSNCRDEFWHWSYGDSAWSVRIGNPTACYGLIEQPEGATRVTGPKIIITYYNSEWPYQFAKLSAIYSEKLGSNITSIEHVGSTAVPGLASKPVLDIDIVVPGESEMAKVIELLKELGYEHQGDLGIPGREAFKLRPPDKEKGEEDKGWPAHHLYACLSDNVELKRHIAFRDYLRANSKAADSYAKLKRELASKYPWDRTRYSEAKTPFVEEILAECGLK